MNPDTINAAFEILGGFFILNHCRVLYKVKAVAGISIASVIFFNVWGFFNLFYYPHLGQTLSFYAAMLITVSNTIWVIMLIKYRHSPQKKLETMLDIPELI